MRKTIFLPVFGQFISTLETVTSCQVVCEEFGSLRFCRQGTTAVTAKSHFTLAHGLAVTFFVVFCN